MPLKNDLLAKASEIAEREAAFCKKCADKIPKPNDWEMAFEWTKSDAIRAKQAAKPKHSPLPESAPSTPTQPDLERMQDALERALRKGESELKSGTILFYDVVRDLAAEGFTLGTPHATINVALEDAACIADKRGQKRTAADIRAMKGATP